MKQRILKKRKELNKIIKDAYGFKVKPKIRLNLNSKRVLGSYHYSYEEEFIRLNPYLINIHGERYINLVFTHEFAHAVVRKKFPSRTNKGKRVFPHGKEFKAVCRLLGIPGRATATL